MSNVIRVLIVEDNPADADLVEELLSEQRHPQFAVQVVSRAAQALESVRTDAPDALLLDLGLPDAQGIDGLRRLRRAAPALPILILTGLRDEEVADLAARTGAQDYLTKGRFESETLSRAIRYAIERKRQEEERLRLRTDALLAQKMEGLGLLTGRIARELNNLLVGVLGNADLALREAGGHPALEQRIEGIGGAAHAASRLVQEMLAYTGQGPMAFEPFDLSSLVEDMGQLLDLSIQRSLTLRYSLGVDLPPVEADTAQIRQVILNLVARASQAMAETSGYVALGTGTMECDQDYLETVAGGTALAPGPYVFLEVTDLGPQLDAEALGSLFDPFGPAANLGLAASLGIVRNHGGGIKALSGDTGTTLKVLLPAAEDIAAAPDLGVPMPWAKGTVLVVDEAEVVRSTARLALELLGFEVVTAADGPAAVERIEHCGGDLAAVLVDEAWLDAVDVSVPVLVLSAAGDPPESVPDEIVLRKPFRLATLVECLGRCLGKPGEGATATETP